ncbi:DUF6875 domain-containing protein [Rhizobium pisi]|uniref:DUF6875 domain-containing protein n=1 Tax=Rhizobium pisi TaxID=574561 RepID=UPI0039AFD96C
MTTHTRRRAAVAAGAVSKNVRHNPSASPGRAPQSTNLFLAEELEDSKRTQELAESDLNALRAVADWINTFVARPHKDLGRAGPVCPFVPQASEHKVLWLAPERIADRSMPDVLQIANAYKRLLLEAQPTNGEGANYNSLVVVFTDLAADRARDFFEDILQRLGPPSYQEDGLALGGFYETNEASAIYNARFRPFTPPVPFLLMRHAVISDWKFFVNDEDSLNRWARRFKESAVSTLAGELRRLPWRGGQAPIYDPESQSGP